MKVYRVEHRKTGEGPYQNIDDFFKWRNVDHTYDNGRPNPFNCGGELEKEMRLGEVENVYSFGFHKKKLYDRWFTGVERKRLAKLGYCLAIYEVDRKNVLLSTTQCAFRNGTLLEKREL